MTPYTLEQLLTKTIEVGECLEWHGAYGVGRNRVTPRVSFRVDGKDKKTGVLRLMWRLTRGEIPEGKIVYRHCGNWRCVCHLKLGVRGDALRRRKALGLSAHSPAALAALTAGARKGPNVKHTVEQADAVRAGVAAGLRDQEIADRTGVSLPMVADIRKGKAWRDVARGASVFSWRPA